MVLTEKLDVSEVERPGEYAWDPIDFEYCALYLCCPFCSLPSAVPYTVIVKEVAPLTLGEDLVCGFCHARFRIEQDKAIRYAIQ